MHQKHVADYHLEFVARFAFLNNVNVTAILRTQF